MYTIRKIYKVEYAHQLKSAYSACCHETIHGHSGIIEVFLSSEHLDKNEMVIDFGEVSVLIKKYLMDTFDHALIIPDLFDKEYIECLKKYNKKLLIVTNNPTAESFCENIYYQLKIILQPIIDKYSDFKIQKIRFHETETGYAEYDGETSSERY